VAALALGLSLTAAAAAVLVREAHRNRPDEERRRRRREAPKADPLGLRRRERAAAGAQRMTISQLDFAISTLQSSSSDQLELTVHETRKAIKRVRTLQRLSRDASPRKQREHRKTVLREAARALSGARDSQVALDTLESVTRRNRRKLGGSPGVSALHAALLREHRAAERALEESGARERAARLLFAARAQFAQQSPAKASRRQAQIVGSGLEHIYAQGRQAMRRARRRSGIAEMHQWRKRVKDLRHAAEALERLPSDARKAKKLSAKHARLQRLAHSADRLGEALGEEHDLALLAERVRAEDEIFRGDSASRKTLLRTIARRRKRLRKRAFKAGAKLYGRKPRRLLERLPAVR
jgi:hypothetical protein